LPETTIAVVTASAVKVTVATLSAAEDEGSAEAYSAVTPVETGLVVVLGATASALDAGLASPSPLTRPPQCGVGVASSVPVSIGVNTLGGS
jgi:hypothetical protein